MSAFGKPISVPLPPNLDLWDGCQIRVTALDPDTGLELTDVRVESVALQIEADQLAPLNEGRIWLLRPAP